MVVYKNNNNKLQSDISYRNLELSYWRCIQVYCDAAGFGKGTKACVNNMYKFILTAFRVQIQDRENMLFELIIGIRST